MDKLNYSDISEYLSDEVRSPVTRTDIDEAKLTKDQQAWRRDGFLVVPGLLPNDLIDAYCAVREKVDIDAGYTYSVPYMHIKELRDLCLYKPLVAKMAELIGQEPGLHLNLTGWKSTQRNFHSDNYLNPPFVGTRYCAAWLALDDVHPHAGPFEWVEGSHLWPTMTMKGLFKHIPESMHLNPAWPRLTQDAVADACEQEIVKRKAATHLFLGKRGDVLLWDSRLVHRGSVPRNPRLLRKTVIAHYSGVNVRKDMGSLITNSTPGSDGRYFALQGSPL